MDKKRRITNPNEFPQDFWNYLVNPILGYYIKPAQDIYGKRSEKDE